MSARQESGYIIAALCLLGAAICAQGGYVTTATHEGRVHAMMRRANREDGREQSSESGDMNMPDEMVKQLKDRALEYRKALQSRQAEPLKVAAEQEKQFIEGMWNDTKSVPIVSVQKMEGSHYRMKGVPGRIVLNLIAKNADTKSRLEHLLIWLQRQMDKHADKVVILSDGYSLLNGGCQDDDLHDRYQRMVADADGPNRGDGPRVVMGAEFGAAGLNPDFVKAFAGWRKQILQQQKNRSEKLYESLASCKGDSSCKAPPRYAYPDLGFIMGPVKDLQRVLRGIQIAYHEKFQPDMNEQLATIDYMIQNPREVALDYGSKLVLSLNDFREPKDVLLIKAGLVTNSVMDDAQCFVHGAGDKYNFAMELSAMLRGEQK
mmetsp:Transcript_135973/g.247937  ORF Transcript_135973/g.247937 Transcript_135973/m.247937 type:complete len:376 (-) Transcript_135973:27-1154(-)